MRLASALVSSLLFAASAAWAAAPTSDQGAAPPHGTQAHAGPSDATNPPGQDINGASAPRESPPALKRAAYPAYGPGEQGTEAACYYVFGQLRCDRVPIRPHK